MVSRLLLVEGKKDCLVWSQNTKFQYVGTESGRKQRYKKVGGFSFLFQLKEVKHEVYFKLHSLHKLSNQKTDFQKTVGKCKNNNTRTSSRCSGY